MGISPKDFAQLQQRLTGRRRPVEATTETARRSVRFTRILGIDPSLRGTGLGVVNFGLGTPVVLHQATLKCPATWPRSRCLARIATAVREAIREYQPDVCAVEGLFFAQNLKTALTMGEARGAALAMVAEAGLPMYELAPRKVKLAIVGFGAAQKLAVAKMVQRLLALPDLPDPDAADALALALAFAQEIRRTTGSNLKPL